MSRHIVRALTVVILLTVATSCALSQSDTTALIAKAKQLKQQGQLPQAQKVLEEALAKAPASVEAHYLLAWVLCGRDQKLEGAKHFYEVVRLDPDSQLAKDAREALKRLGLPDPPPASAATTPPQPAVPVETKPDKPAAPPTPPAPATEKQPAPTVEATPPPGPLQTQLIDDFEAPDFAWEGLKRSDLAAGTGKFGGAWLDTVGTTSVQTHAFKNDWSDFTHLQFDCSALVDDGALITISLGSDNPATPENDFYYLRFPINWQGWKTFQLPLSAFTVSGKPLGFSHITNIYMASNWGPCKPLPTTQLGFDNFKLVKLGAAKSLVIGNMEDDLAMWEGLTAERQLVKEGEGAGRWEHLDQTPQISWHGGQHDWHPFGALHMWVYSEVANNQDVRVVAWSDNPDTKEMDGYRCDLKIDWKGWKELRLEDADFQTSYQPLGWDQIKSLDIVGAGWGGMAPAKPDTMLVFDDVRLELLDTTKDLGFMDFDTTARTTFTEGPALTTDKAHEGTHSLLWKPTQEGLAFANIPHDWSAFKTLSFWLYTPDKNQVAVALVVSDRFGDPRIDSYGMNAKVAGGGWTLVTMPLKDAAPQGNPLGWNNCQRLYVLMNAAKTEDYPKLSPIYLDDFTLSVK